MHPSSGQSPTLAGSKSRSLFRRKYRRTPCYSRHLWWSLWSPTSSAMIARFPTHLILGPRRSRWGRRFRTRERCFFWNSWFWDITHTTRQLELFNRNKAWTSNTRATLTLTASSILSSSTSSLSTSALASWFQPMNRTLRLSTSSLTNARLHPSVETIWSYSSQNFKRLLVVLVLWSLSTK